MITIVAKITLKPGVKADFVATVQEMIKKSRAEAGNAAYDLYEDIEDRNVVSFIEQWKDEAAIESHNATAHFKAGIAAMKPLADNIEIVRYRKL